MVEKQLPSPKEAIEEFIERHFILDTELIQRDRLAIYWTTVTNLLIHKSYSSLSDETFLAEPTIGLLLNMLDRTFEHVEGAIVAYDTGSMASSEVVARVATESAVNVMYILDRDRVSRMTAYFNSYFDYVESQVKKWLNTTSRMSDMEAKVHREAAQRRRNAVRSVKKYMDHVISQIPSETNNTNPVMWPNVFERFRELGLESHYRTMYARMSSQTHNDAEDTINYFLGVVSDNELLMERLSLETVNFSRLLVYFGVLYYLKTSIKFAETFQLIDVANKIRKGHEIINQQIREISLDVGAF
jgi:hypothetical protein